VMNRELAGANWTGDGSVRSQGFGMEDEAGTQCKIPQLAASEVMSKTSI
jgi:hypothetical protein